MDSIPSVFNTNCTYMTKLKSEEIAKLYWSIGEVAKQLGCSQSCIRFWCDQFELKIPKNRKGNRFFNYSDILHLIAIKELIHKDMYTIKGAKKQYANKIKELQMQVLQKSEKRKIQQTVD